MEPVVSGRALGDNHPHPRVRRIYLYHELTRRVWMCEDWGCGEASLKLGEGGISFKGPGKWDGCGGEL